MADEVSEKVKGGRYLKRRSGLLVQLFYALGARPRPQDALGEAMELIYTYAAYFNEVFYSITFPGFFGSIRAVVKIKRSDFWPKFACFLPFITPPLEPSVFS